MKINKWPMALLEQGFWPQTHSKCHAPNFGIVVEKSFYKS